MSRSEQAYRLAQEQYAAIGVDTEAALKTLSEIPISLHCWQGDDVGGFEDAGCELGGGLQCTGDYPGRARTPVELRTDLEFALRLIPGRHRLNLHAIYAETGGRRVGRDRLTGEHFVDWIAWAQEHVAGLDFNPTFFAHPLAATGFTLSSPDTAVRDFWIAHGRACRRIAEEMGRALGTHCIMNTWIPDGFKDVPIDRKAARERLTAALDAVFAEPTDPAYQRDALESKLFGIGAESCTIGSHEFYLGYALTRGKLLCLDVGHFHPTEVISDKLSAVLGFLDEVLLHVSRPVRWDSDHVVILDDELRAIAAETVRGDYLGRVHFGLDFFDASINRVAAWVIGTRALLRALCIALLEPTESLRAAEVRGDYTARLAWLEELKAMPSGAVWDWYCQKQGVPIGPAWLADVREYEARVLAHR